MERLLDAPPLKVIRDATGTLEGMAFLAAPPLASGFFLAHLVAGRMNDRALEIILVLAGPLIVAVGVGAWYYVARICDPAPYKIKELKGSLLVESVGNHHRYTHERTATIRATRNNVRLVEYRSHWTGNGSKGRRRVESLMSDQQLFVSRRAEEDGRLHLWVYLGEPLGKGEETCVSIREVFEDNLEPMRQYFRKGSDRFKARRLTVTVSFAADEDPVDVEGLIWNNDRKSRERATVGTVPRERLPNPETGTVDYTVFVWRPKRYHSYGMRWRWASDGPSANGAVVNRRSSNRAVAG